MNLNATQSLLAWTDKVLEHRQNLLRRYQAHDLHQFRVHTRRIRTVLKYLPGYLDRPLRKTWKAHFVVTNPARDWDVFFLAARDHLSPGDWRTFSSILRKFSRQEHTKVLDMLQSAGWRSHSAAWLKFMRGLNPGPQSLPPQLFPAIRAEAEAARVRALAENSQMAWHRFRIATKNLRYIGDIAAQTDAPDPAIESLIESCKAIQDLLGDWHDCMVQLELLQSPGIQYELARHPQGGALAGHLLKVLQERRQYLLNSARTEKL